MTNRSQLELPDIQFQGAHVNCPSQHETQTPPSQNRPDRRRPRRPKFTVKLQVATGRARLQTAGPAESEHLIPVTNGNPVGSGKMGLITSTGAMRDDADFTAEWRWLRRRPSLTPSTIMALNRPSRVAKSQGRTIPCPSRESMAVCRLG